MENNRFVQYYRELQTRYAEYFNKLTEAADIEDVHQLRVSIKMLRTVWSLMASASHGVWNKEDLSAQIAPVFRQAGKLRETQINLKLIMKFPEYDLEPYAEYLREKQERAYTNLLTTLQQCDEKLIRKQNMILPEVLEGVQDDDVLEIACDYAMKQVRKVKKLRRYLPGNYYLHQIRIHLIALRESVRIIHLLTDEPEVETLRKDLRAFTLKLGKWHDYTVLLGSIKKYARSRDLTERKKLDKFRTYLQMRQGKRQLALRREIFRISKWKIKATLKKFFENSIQ
jgi:CHAD domain-containing protein